MHNLYSDLTNQLYHNTHIVFSYRFITLIMTRWFVSANAAAALMAGSGMVAWFRWRKSYHGDHDLVKRHSKFIAIASRWISDDIIFADLYRLMTARCFYIIDKFLLSISFICCAQVWWPRRTDLDSSNHCTAEKISIDDGSHTDDECLWICCSGLLQP